MQRNDKSIFIKLRSWLLPGVIAMLVFLGLKTFVFSLENVSSHDMQPNLKEGDMVLVGRTASHFSYGDVLVFNYLREDTGTSKKSIQFIQRCVALPGDSIYFLNGYVFVNNKEEPANYPVQYNYHIKTAALLDSAFLEKYGLTEGGILSDEMDYSYSLTKQAADSLARDSMIKLIEKKVEKSDVRDEEIFPHDSKYKWNKYNTGTFYIPRKGDTLLLDTNSICFYAKLITDHERNVLKVKSDSIFVNSELTKAYVVKKDYYFVLGDNRDNSIDSRYWGFLPEDQIKGKVVSVILSRKAKAANQK